MQYFKKFRFFREFSRREIALFASALVVYIGLTLGNMTRWSIWFDEGFSAYMMRFSFADIVRYTAADVHPPLYYWLWVSMWGTSDFALRSLSMILIAATIIVVTGVVYQLFGKRAALWSAVLLAVSPQLIRFGDEARMYALVALITASATAVLVSSMRHPTRKKWIMYGVLVSLGMWTHYFTAFVWLSHWVWRWLVRRDFVGARPYFSRGWILSHVCAIGIFIPWLPFMIKQLTTIQSTGFWISPVTIDTPMNYITNMFLHLPHSEVKGWLAAIVLVFVASVITMLRHVVPKLTSKLQPAWRLVVSMAFVPPVLIFLLSLPPLKSSFIERYMLPSVIWTIVFVGVLLSRYVSMRNKMTWVAPVVTVVVLILGVGNVYAYGNFNRDARPSEAQSIKQVISMIHDADSTNTPIIADSPWRFYEAIQYDSAVHPVYFIADDQAVFGSYDMLRFSDDHKIKDLKAFQAAHPVIWYLANWYNDEPRTPSGMWHVETMITGPTPVVGSSVARAYKLQSTQ